jgi:SAM-dependent methyltransferase
MDAAPSASSSSVPADWTDRQRREREYYETYAGRTPVEDVGFDPVLSSERRPWNSYWDTYRTVTDLHGPTRHRLLDVGTGEGVAAVRYAKVGYEVWGFDISEHNVRKARELAARHGLSDRTHFAVHAAETMPYDDASFDVVTGIDILHHVDIPRVTEEVKRVLAPGGRAVFREWVEVPVLDPIRKTSVMRALFPRAMSFDDHITFDEHPLTKDELTGILDAFPEHAIRRYGFLSRLRKIAPAPRGDIPDQVEKLDRSLFRLLPWLRHFGGEILLVLRG